MHFSFYAYSVWPNNNIRLIRRCQNATCYNDMDRTGPKFVGIILLWSGRIWIRNVIRHSPKRSTGHPISCKAILYYIF